MPTVIVASHPEVRVDPAVEVPQWSLAPRGRQRATALAQAPLMGGVTSVWSSTERKAVETATIVASALEVPALRLASLGENDRSATGFLPPPEFEATADAFFASPHSSVRGWEPAADAQRRITRAVTQLLAEPRTGPGDVLIVSHGAVGTLLLCQLLGRSITRELDQPRQGCMFAFDRDTAEVRHTWVPFEDAIQAYGARARR